jgi:tetratricopeptide (TPR) repeat protein
MEHEVEVLTNNPTWGHAVLQYEVSTAAYYGRFARAREFARRAVDIAQKGDKQQNAAVDEAQIGLAEALVGNRASARQWITSALALSRFRDVEGIAGLALSLSGDSAAAIKLANDLNHRFPQDSIIQSNYLPTIRAATHLSNDGHNPEPAKAIQALAPAAPYELGFTALEQGLSLYPVYVRGQAYLAAKEASSAATEFQKILNHPGAVQNEPIGALAHLGLGRACVHSQDTSKAKTEYETFLEIWKDADPDIPILKQAKAEYAKLR